MQNAEPFRPRRLNPTESAQRPRLFLFFSAGLNLALLLFLALVFRRSDPRTAPAIPLSGETMQANRHVRRTDGKRGTARVQPVSPWSQLESADLSLYAANLRAAGCPEKTVRDILLPLIEGKFEPTLSEPTNFWASFSQRQAAASAYVEQEKVLSQQKNALLEQMLGFAWSSEGLKKACDKEAAAAFGFIDYDRAEKILCIAQRFNAQFARVRRADRRLNLYEAWRENAGEIVSPTEFEEVELRGVLMRFQRHNPKVCNASFSGSELRQLMAFQRELVHPLPTALLDGNEGFVQEPASNAEEQFLAKTRSILGESRFLDFLKNSDPSMERTLTALDNEHLPRSLALPLFDFRLAALNRAQEIRKEFERPAEKRAQLAALRQNALEQIGTLRKGENETPLLKLNQDWLQEIAKP